MLNLSLNFLWLNINTNIVVTELITIIDPEQMECGVYMSATDVPASCSSICVVTGQDVVLVPLCRSAAGRMCWSVAGWTSVLQHVGGLVLRGMLRVGDLSDRPAAAVPSPVFYLHVGSLEEDGGQGGSEGGLNSTRRATANVKRPIKQSSSQTVSTEHELNVWIKWSNLFIYYLLKLLWLLKYGSI